MSNDSENFECQRCGNCCRECGYVHLSEKEIDACAAFLDLAINDFTDKYTRLTKHRSGLSLTEQNNGACIFLSQDGQCLIEPVKPLQCRQFPFAWKYKDVEKICKGWGKRENYEN